MVFLRNIRERQGLLQEEIAKTLGVSRSAIAMWESGKANPRGETLVKLADALNCTIDELYGRSPPCGPGA